ncbi:hypothetical protein PTKIN_Ptkin06aG0076700 [Pterospermum kingtungense]
MMEASSSTDPPAGDVQLIPEKVKDAKEGGPAFHCGLCDTELVYKIVQALLPGLATACVDNTTGGIFRSPGSVAAEIRKEMVEYLIQRSENFVAESVVLDGGPEAEASDHPYDIIACFVDDFASSKRNFFSRVSAWLLSEKREDKIDDFAQEMEINGFWLIDKREAIVQTLVKNVDFKNEFHCDMKLESADELALHVPTCGFRSMNCENEGCDARFSANQTEKHDSVCPFKIIPCEQKCPNSIMRREMDRHCITVCPMKLVNCPFFSVGCKSAVPQCKMEEHHSTDLHSHMLYILQAFHKEAPLEVLKERVEQIEQASSGTLAEVRSMRSLTMRVKDLDAQLGPLVFCATNKTDEEGEATKTEEANAESLEGNDTNKDTEKAAETKAIDSEAEPRTSEVTSTNKKGEESTKTDQINYSEAKLQSLEVAPLNKDGEEASKTEVMDAEAKPRSIENATTNKDSEESTETDQINDSEAKLQSLEVTVPLNKDSEEEASTTEVKDAEAKPGSIEDATTNIDSEEGAKTKVQVSPTNKVSEAEMEVSVKDGEGKLQALEVSATDKTSEDGKETLNRVPNTVEN